MAWARLAQIQTTLLQSSLKIFMIESQPSNLIIVPTQHDMYYLSVGKGNVARGQNPSFKKYPALTCSMII